MSDPNPHAEFDVACKEAMDLYFESFLELLFPSAHALLDWTQPIEFLDTELERLLPESEIGRKVADKLVKAFTQEGSETFILVHVEVQSQEDSTFAERMFIYHYRIFDTYRRPVMSLAVLGDERRNWRPSGYGYCLGECRIRLDFPMVKLADFETKWSELENSLNPIAVVVMAHLRTTSTLGDPLSRKQWKWILTRQLFERGYTKEDVIRLFRVMDWMMALPKDLHRQFKQELDPYQEEYLMPRLTSIEEIAKEEGIEQGIQLGLVRQLLKVLRRRFQTLPEILESSLLQLNPEQLENLMDPALDTQSIHEFIEHLPDQS